jgi:uncharacterized protein (DUF1919 family)
MRVKRILCLQLIVVEKRLFTQFDSCFLRCFLQKQDHVKQHIPINYYEAERISGFLPA